MLGLQDYASDESPAPNAATPDGAAAPAAAESSNTRLLSITSYAAEDDAERAAQLKDAAKFGVALDEDEPDRGGASTTSRVGGVGVQVSVVKRAAGGAAAAGGFVEAEGAAAASAAAAAAATSESGRPAFVVPDSPPGDLNPKALERHLSYVDKLSKGMHVNDHIRNAKKFRNPCLLDKLVAMIGVQEFGSNYPTDLYDPNSLTREEHYDALELQRKAWEEKQKRKSGEKVEFRSSGSQQPSAAAPLVNPAAAAAAGAAALAASAAATDDSAAPGKRKSKWDSAGDASRQRQ